MTALIIAATFSLQPGWAASKFVQNLHKAESRKEPNERVEYYTRAIDAWEPAEGNSLMGACRFGRGEALVELWKFAEAEPDVALTGPISRGDVGTVARHLAALAGTPELGRNNEAALDLLEFAGRNPADVDGLVTLADAQLKAGRGDAAMKACKLAEQAEPSDFRGWLCEGRALAARRDWPGAERAFAAADDRAEHRAAAPLLERAVTLVAQGRHELALTDYSAAIPLLDALLETLPHDRAPAPAVAEHRQNTARAYYSRGRVREFLVQPELALADFETACRLGHDQACERADALAPQAEHKPKRAAPSAAPEPVPEKSKREKRRKVNNPDSDPGERIYGG